MKILQSKGTRLTQEDGFFFYKFDNFEITGIIDGHGGASLVNDIKENYVVYLKKFLKKEKRKLSDHENFSRLIKDFYMYLDEMYIKKKEDSGCCISVIFYDVTKNRLIIVQLGDTKILIYDKKKKLLYNTREHRLTEKEIDRITKQKGEKNIRNLNGVLRYKSLMITRVLGDYSCKNKKVSRDKDALSPIPEVFVIDILDVLYCMLLTDGVYEKFSVENISKLYENTEIENIPNIIMEECKKFSKLDNITIIYQKYTHRSS